MMYDGTTAMYLDSALEAVSSAVDMLTDAYIRECSKGGPDSKMAYVLDNLVKRATDLLEQLAADAS